MSIFKSRSAFDEYLRDKFDQVEENMYVVMRAAYSFKELLETKFTLDIAFLRAVITGDCVDFFGKDYDEQQYFEVYAYYTESELLKILMQMNMRTTRDADEYSEGEQ